MDWRDFPLLAPEGAWFRWRVDEAASIDESERRGKSWGTKRGAPSLHGTDFTLSRPRDVVRLWPLIGHQDGPGLEASFLPARTFVRAPERLAPRDEAAV